MKCQICNKNDAEIFFTQIKDNEKTVLQICMECAKKKGLSIEFESHANPSSSPEIFFDKGLESEINKEEEKDIPNLTCDVCGLTFVEFKKSGLFGCDNCHKAFGTHIKSIMKQIHGTAVHEGKAPKKDSKVIETKQKLKILRARLKHCVEMEDYERAAQLRDQIAELQKDKNISN